MEEKFIEFMENSGLSKNTVDSYLNDMKKFKDYYEDSYGEKLKNIIHADVMMYKSYLKKTNMSPTTINRKIAAIKQYNLFLIDNGFQESIVISKKDYIKIQKTMIGKKLPTEKEIDKLKHSASRNNKNAKRDYCLMTIFIYGGLRESEIVNIRLVDIKMEERFINIIGKGNKFRQVVINNYMYDAIESFLEERMLIETDNPYLFIGQKNKNNKKPLSRNFCNRILDEYKDLCKGVKLHPHLLRSFFCTNAIHNAGYTIDQVANQAGHSSLNTTKAYITTGYEDIISKANKL